MTMKYLVLAGFLMTPFLGKAAELTDFSHTWELDANHSDRSCSAQLNVYYVEDSQSLNFQFSTTTGNVRTTLVENYQLGKTVRSDLNDDTFDVSVQNSQLQVARWHTKRTLFGRKTRMIENTNFSLQPDHSLEMVRIAADKDATRCLYRPVFPTVMGKTVQGAELVLDGKTVSRCSFDAAGTCDLGKYVVEGQLLQSRFQLAPNERFGSLVLERNTPLLYSSVHYRVSYVTVWVENQFGDKAFYDVFREKAYSTPYSENEVKVGTAINGSIRYVYE